jgi:spermidine synthase
VVVTALLAVGVASSNQMTSLFEEQQFLDEVVWAKSTPYQRIVLTHGKSGFSMFLNGNLQFSSVDEYRYHEALVHPAFMYAAERKKILILGGGDGLAAREILSYPEVESVTLVDLDAAVTNLGKSFEELSALNQHSLTEPRLHLVTDDAMQFLARGHELYDVVVVDFPDPNNFSLGKLYTTRFYAQVKEHLKPDGAAVIQSTSPLFARQSFWCVENTLRAAGFQTRPYHVWVPSFGEWGYVLASATPFVPRHELPPNLKFLTTDTLPALYLFPKDMEQIPAEVNRLNNQVLVRYYEAEWRRWN